MCRLYNRMLHTSMCIVNMSILLSSSSASLTDDHSSVVHQTTSPSGPVTAGITAALLLGTSHTFSGLDTWRSDHYVIPHHTSTLGVGDTFFICRTVHTAWTNCLSLPAFEAQLTAIVGWGDDLVEFQVTNLTTGCIHHTTLLLPLYLTRLSGKERLSRRLWPFPRCSKSLATHPLKVIIPRHQRFSRVIGDRVPRDSDGLPIWDGLRNVNKQTRGGHGLTDDDSFLYVLFCLCFTLP